MIPSSICFLFPLFFLDCIPMIQYSLIFLTITSFLYHSVEKKNPFYPFFYLFDHIGIINFGSIFYFQSYSISFYYNLLFLIEYYFWRTKKTVFFIYGLNLFQNLQYKDNRIFLWFFISSIMYFNTYRRNENRFLNYERWIWHFGQSMYIYHSLKYNLKLLL